MKCLIIKKKWLDLILSGDKVWEVRGRNTKIRGKIGLIESGSGKVVGICNLSSSGSLTHDEYCDTRCYHRVPTSSDNLIAKYKSIYFWKLEDVKKLSKPISYKHPQGAVIWVNVNNKELEELTSGL